MAVHPRVATTLEDLGRNVRDWRKIHGLTAASSPSGRGSVARHYAHSSTGPERFGWRVSSQCWRPSTLIAHSYLPPIR